GESVTPLTQCAHWHFDLDIIAIKHASCQKFDACISCHNASESAHHVPEVWQKDQRDVKAVLCGVCKDLLSVSEYMACGSRCPRCGKGFNSGRKGHWALYFEIGKGEG
ncbi:hypothetical protein P154DRAFT_432584, partial [Amniculicola lignicola CBS 123094]